MTFPSLVANASVDVALAVRRYLASIDAVLVVLGPTGSDSADDVWLFTSELQVVVEGTSSVAAVVSVSGAWSRPNLHNTGQFPRLRLELIADATRVNSLIVRRDAEARAWAAWRPLNIALDRKDAFSEFWGRTDSDPGLRVWGASLLSHPDTVDIPEFDGGKRLICNYGLCVG